MYFIFKSLHIIFVVTWFSGLFYVVRLFVYNREAVDKPEIERRILQQQFAIMIRRLWYGITWPSCIGTVIFGVTLLQAYPLGVYPTWLWIKLGLVVGLIAYHLYLHRIFLDQSRGIFQLSSQRLRILNEGATVFLVAIVFLVVARSAVVAAYGIAGLVVFCLVLLLAIELYRRQRKIPD